MTDIKIGDLVQYTSVHRAWNNKVGVIADLRKPAGIAFIYWADNLANSVWVRIENLKLLK